jgi:D-sedoheptulose 7-phosphate isomerase
MLNPATRAKDARNACHCSFPVMKIRHVILDRDGVLNDERSPPDDFQWIAGALEGLRILQDAGIELSIATNQSAVGRGSLTPTQLDSVHDLMRATALAQGVQIGRIFSCVHAPDDGCTCRKPAPGLIIEAIGASRIDSGETLVVGDSCRDLEAGWNAGVRAVLLRTGKGRQMEHQARSLGAPVYDDLHALAASIAGGNFQSATMRIEESVAEHTAVLAEATRTSLTALERASQAILHCLTSGKKILACGNGGSAADAQHLIAEIVGRFRTSRRALPGIALMGDAATMTALANDFGYENVFARQIEAVAASGDVLIALSTSGNSPNVIQAARTARTVGCIVIGLSGADGGTLAAHADILIRIPSTITARIQEAHQFCIHALAESIDGYFTREAFV